MIMDFQQNMALLWTTNLTLLTNSVLENLHSMENSVEVQETSDFPNFTMFV